MSTLRKVICGWLCVGGMVAGCGEGPEPEVVGGSARAEPVAPKLTKSRETKGTPQGAVNPEELSATFSIAAVDPETGICGVAVASKYPAVGAAVPFARAGAGAFCTQHYHVPSWGPRALDLLAGGKSAGEVLIELLADDKAPGQRQLAAVDRQGRTANHNPLDAPRDSRWWGSMAGRNYTCQGNTLTGSDVVTSMGAAFERTRGSLADRLMAALVAGDCAGGDHRGRLAAGIVVAKPGVEGSWFELRVDKSDDAVLDLAKKYIELKHDAKGEWATANTPWKHPCANRPPANQPVE